VALDLLRPGLVGVKICRLDDKDQIVAGRINHSKRVSSISKRRIVELLVQMDRELC
jgi:hypothetical protein